MLDWDDPFAPQPTKRPEPETGAAVMRNEPSPATDSYVPVSPDTGAPGKIDDIQRPTINPVAAKPINGRKVFFVRRGIDWCWAVLSVGSNFELFLPSSSDDT